MKTKSPLFRIDRLLIAALALFAAPQVNAQLYTGTNSTGLWNTSRWSTATNGPFSSPWTANSASLFKAGTGTYTFTGANSSGAVSVGNITLEDNVTVNFSAQSGTLSGGGVVRTISVGSGSTLDFGSQGFTTGGQGWIKTGNGVLALAGGAFTNGFTLDGGVVVMRGVDAMGAGSGNILTLSNGTVAASANRALTTAKYGGGIRIRGNITFGALTNVTTLSSATANISFANDVDLGGSTRTLTIGGNGTYTFSGVMSNGGLTVAAEAGATGNLTLSASNTYTGKTTINSGTVILSGSGTAGTTASDLEVAGGLLNLSAGTKTNAAFTLSGGTITNGTLQATSYALQGGTIISNATLGTGTATVTTGTTTLNGLLNATTVNVNSGALNLGAADRLANGAAVTIAGGTLGMGANNDTVSTFTMTSGTLGGSGTLTAASYSLQGGTITANLGSGAATNSAGTTTLNGTLGTTNLVVSGGTINLGSATRLDNGLALTISGGTLGLGANSDTVGSFAISSGTLDGSGTITASTYALDGGTVTGNLGAGTINVGGSAALNGTAAATAINVNSGTLTLGSGSRFIGTTPAVTMAGGTLALGGAETIGSLTGSSGTVALDGNTLTVGAGNATSTYSGGITGTGGGLTKTGNGVLTLAANSSYTGATTINAGTLVYNGTNTSTAVAVNSGTTLAGSGSVGATTISSGGTMSPGSSPGTQTYASLTWEGGANYNWQLYNATGVAGTDYDTFVSTGAFTINATSGNKFNINLWTLSGIGPDTNGSALNFNAATSTNWTLGTFGSISGFSADAFAINPFATNGTSGFANIFTGTFSVNTNGSSLLLVYTAPEIGDEFEWGAGSGNWNTSGNWTNNSVPPATGAKIYYSGGGGLSTNDVATAINGLTFLSGAGAYTVSGDALTIGLFGVANDSTAVQTVDLDVVLGGNQIFEAASGDLVIGGAVNNDGNLLTVDGAENVSLNGVVSGSGGVTKIGNGTLTLGGNSTFSGTLAAEVGTVLISGTQGTTTLNVDGGTLLLGANDVLANGATLTLSSGTVNLGGFSDTLATYNQSAGVFTNGTLTASTYGLSGGTVGGTLSGGTANVTGAVSLSGAINSTLNVNSGGTLTLAANDRIGNGSAVTVNGGTLATVTFSDTIGSLVLTNSGTVSGTGVLTATTYTLGGGTVSGALGAGTANVTGEVSLTGTMDSTTLNVNTGGTLTLGSADRIGGSTAVVIGGGTLAMGANNDTVGSFSITSGTLGGTGTLTAATYSLGGGTVNANLGTGTATAASGSTTLNGTLAADLAVSGGTVTAGAADRIGNFASVSITSGTLNLGGFSDTVEGFTISGGAFANGTLTAETYNLDGGTIGSDANLGAGTANVTNGTVTLDGTLAATTLNIAGGTLEVGNFSRIGNATAVNLSSGVLDMNTFTDGVGSFAITGGTLSGSGTLNADTGGFSLQGGTVNANLGTGSVTASTGTTAVNGTVAGNVTVSGGTVNLGAADRIGNSSTVNVSSGALNLGGNDTVGAVTLTGGTIGGSGVLTGTSYAVQDGTISAGIGGSGAMTKTGAGTTTLSANNSGFSGAVAVNQGAILASTSGALGTGTVTMSSGSTLAASGATLANDFTIGSAGGSQVFYSQNFNNLGSGLPTDWSVRTSASSSSLGTSQAFTTTQISWADTGATFKNYASATGLTSSSDLDAQNASTDRALGARQSGSFGDPGASFNYAFSTTGEVIESISLDLMLLDVEARTTTWSIQYGIGAAPTTFTLLGTWTDPATWGTTTLTFDTSDFGSALDNQANLVFRVAALSSSTGSGSRDSMSIDNFVINSGGGAPTGSGTLGIEEAGVATFSGNILNNNNATFTAASGGTATFSGAISGAGTLSKTGIGTVTLSGTSANTFTGVTTVTAGTLELNKTAGVTALASTNIIVSKIDNNNRATLLLSAGGQVANSTAVTLSGGTITRGSGVSEVFGNLNLTEASFLDFGTGDAGNLAFGTYTSSALLTVQNFLPGNKLQFATGFDANLLPTGGNLSNANFSFSNGFTTGTEGGYFTITAIPEPSTYLAAAGLLSLMLWPSRKRLLKDARKILGLTPPMRDRLAARREQKMKLEA
jgi:fibronectin-binding autotransporter adhesin